jgi:hypothetical protein
MRGACDADDPWHGYGQKFRVFFREAITVLTLVLLDVVEDAGFRQRQCLT